MAVYDVFKICETCGGDGIREYVLGDSSWGDEECPQCEGTGKYVSGSVDLSDLDDKIDDVVDKCNDILEQVSE
jgi:DnaJ-class molecular chaperone